MKKIKMHTVKFVGKMNCLNLATQSVIHGPAALTAPGSLLEMQTLRPHPRPTESEFAF